MKLLSIIVMSFFFGSGLLSQETPTTLREQGLALLKEAQTTPDKIVDAAKFLAQAADGFTAAGNEAEAEEVNSCLYWAKKKMTLAQIDAYLAKGNGTAKATVAKMESVEKQEVKVEDAGKWLAKADGYAEAAKDPFLAAVRYFEVASRFKGTPEGEQALEKTMKFLQQAKVAVPVDATKVVGAAVKGDGKVYVQSIPVGASILVEAEDGLRDTGSKTPSLVQLRKGDAKLVLRKEKYEDSKVNVSIGDAIVKTEVVKLNLPKVDMEILSVEAGWRVFLLENNKPVSLCDKAGKQAVTPCTVCLEEGVKTLVLAKEGFRDQSRRVTVGKDVAVNFERKGSVGQSQAMGVEKAINQTAFVGTWVKTDTNTSFEIQANGKILAPKARKVQYASGKWEIRGETLVLIYGSEEVILNLASDGSLKGKWSFERK